MVRPLRRSSSSTTLATGTNQRFYGEGTRKEAAVEAASAQWLNGASGNN